MVKAIKSGYQVRGVFGHRNTRNHIRVIESLPPGCLKHFEYHRAVDPLIHAFTGYAETIRGATYVIYTPSESIFDVSSTITAPQYR